MVLCIITAISIVFKSVKPSVGVIETINIFLWPRFY